MASSLDKVHAKLSLPKEISENRFVEMVTEACKLYFLPYSSQRYTESKLTGPMREYEVEAEVDGRGRYLSVKAKENGETFMLEIFLSDGTQENFFQSALRNLLVTKLSKN